MNIIGEYNIQYNIYTMFDVYNVKITNHNLITDKGYEFFLEKWYKSIDYPIELGYYHENKFYDTYNSNTNEYSNELNINNGTYSTTINYIDKQTNKQYKFDGTNFIEFNEKIEKICIGNCTYTNENPIKPSNKDVELYNQTNEYMIDDFDLDSTKLIMKYEIESRELNGTTEIGVKTNHGRLLSHDIHPPYNLPFGTNIILEYIFRLN